MKTDRPGVLVCVCDAKGRILLDAPYEYHEKPVCGTKKSGGALNGAKGGRQDEGTERRDIQG